VAANPRPESEREFMGITRFSLISIFVGLFPMSYDIDNVRVMNVGRHPDQRGREPVRIRLKLCRFSDCTTDSPIILFETNLDRYPIQSHNSK
jgi:hypothetical protein